MSRAKGQFVTWAEPLGGWQYICCMRCEHMAGFRAILTTATAAKADPRKLWAAEHLLACHPLNPKKDEDE